MAKQENPIPRQSVELVFLQARRGLSRTCFFGVVLSAIDTSQMSRIWEYRRLDIGRINVVAFTHQPTDTRSMKPLTVFGLAYDMKVAYRCGVHVEVANHSRDCAL